MDEAQPNPIATWNTTPLWWGYLVFVCLWFVFGMISAARAGIGDLLFGLSALVDLVCIYGLNCYIEKRPFISVWLWRGILAIYVSKIAFGTYMFAANLYQMLYRSTLYPWRLDREFYVAALGVGGVVTVVPMIIALWNYGFRSPAIWRRTG